jgi:hypothetical protein
MISFILDGLYQHSPLLSSSHLIVAGLFRYISFQSSNLYRAQNRIQAETVIDQPPYFFITTRAPLKPFSLFSDCLFALSLSDITESEK